MGPPPEKDKGLMSRLSMAQRVAVVHALVEGCSISTTSRMTGVSRPTILRLLLVVGEGCRRLHNLLARDLEVHQVEMDELWTFVHKKESRVAPTDPTEWGDNYVYVALARASKFVIAYRVGKRDQPNGDAFARDFRARLKTIPSISSDAWSCYEPAIGQAFGGPGGGVDYGQVVKNYSRKPRRADGQPTDHRYEPPRDPFITKRTVMGAPDMRNASTSLVERQNWTTRGGLRRMTRLSNGFSHKKEALAAAVALWYAFYNFCRIHETIRCTPAMEVGVTDHVWSVEELVARALSAEPCEPPPPTPLQQHPDAAGSARLTSTGFMLRAVPDAKGHQGTAPAERPAAHPQTGQRAPTEEERQGDLFVWAASRPAKPLPPPGTQLTLFDL